MSELQPLIGKGVGLRVMAVIQCLLAVALGAMIVVLWDGRDLVGSLAESILWIFLTAVLLLVAWGLWRRRPWARTLALVLHWPLFVGACALLLASVVCLLLVPPGGIDVFRAMAQIGLVGLPLIAAVSSWTLWYLYCCVDRQRAPGAQ
jgi:hypothetical protein